MPVLFFAKNHPPSARAVNSSRWTRGFSLIEILLFLLVVLALVTILLSSAGVLSKTRGVNLESIASKIASCEIEQLRNTLFSSISDGTNVDIGPPCSQDLSKLPEPRYARKTIAPYQSDPDIKQVTLTVSWTEKGVAQNIIIETLISRYGL